MNVLHLEEKVRLANTEQESLKTDREFVEGSYSFLIQTSEIKTKVHISNTRHESSFQKSAFFDRGKWLCQPDRAPVMDGEETETIRGACAVRTGPRCAGQAPRTCSGCAFGRRGARSNLGPRARILSPSLMGRAAKTGSWHRCKGFCSCFPQENTS